MAGLLDEDRLFPVEPSVRALARALYAEVRDLPIISPHGHTEPRWYAENERFPDPAQLLIVPDHYIFRMLVSQGVRLETSACRPRTAARSRRTAAAIWRLFASNYHLFRGTPTRSWLDHTFATLFGSTSGWRAARPTRLYDHIAACLARRLSAARAVRALQPRGDLDHRRGALDDLRWHRMIRESGWRGRVITTYRPDSVVDPDFDGFAANLDRLGEMTGCDTGTGPAISRRTASAAPSSGARRHRHRPRPSDGRAPPNLTPKEAAALFDACAGAADARRRRAVPRPDAHRDGEA
jgi:glucuronate isomerase